MKLMLFAPELLLLIGSLCLFMLSLGKPFGRSTAARGLTVGLAAVSIILCFVTLRDTGSLFFDAYKIDLFSQLFKLVISVGLFVVVVSPGAEKEVRRFLDTVSVSTRVAIQREPTGMLDATALSVGATYARRLTDKFLVGGQARYAYQHLGESIFANVGVDLDSLTVDSTFTKTNDVSGLSFEIGTIFYPGLWPSLKVGMDIKNFSQEFEYKDEPFQLPLTFTLGFAVDLFEVIGLDGGNSLLLAVDALHPRDYSERIHVGAEFGFMNMAFIRAGYKFNYDIESLSLGGGLNLALVGVGLRVDAAYSLIEDFDDVLRFTVGASF